MRQRTARLSPEEATVRIGATLEVPAVLRSLGADPRDVLGDLGLDLSLFDDPDNRISYAARGRLISRCVERTGCRHFGLLVGQRSSLDALGLVGILVKYSPDVGTALRSLVHALHLHVRGGAADLAVNGDRAVLTYDIYQSRVAAADQIGDGALAMTFNIMHALCGPDWKPTEVLFSHRRPENVGPYRRLFQAPLVFDAERYALVFSAVVLNRPLSSSDPDLRRLLQKQIDALDARHGDEFAERVRSVLRTALLTGHARADQVAALFSMHSRTLARHLDAVGTSFQALVDECGFEIARQFLELSDQDVAQIAATLRYADASAFTRAFRRWSGTTPARWRAANRQAA
jgi:AraC-like DNA-binding protein